MADIERAGLQFFNIVETPKSKIRRVEISPFVQVYYIEEEDDDFSGEEICLMTTLSMKWNWIRQQIL